MGKGDHKKDKVVTDAPSKDKKDKKKGLTKVEKDILIAVCVAAVVAIALILFYLGWRKMKTGSFLSTSAQPAAASGALAPPITPSAPIAAPSAPVVAKA